MAIHKTRGFILRRDDIRETSILLTVYSRDFGKLKLISKGVRSPEQRFVSAYELFALDEIVFYEKKKKNLFLLSQCELVNFFPKIRESLKRISYASYFIELLDAVTPFGEKSAALYELLLKSILLLSTDASPKRVARIFEIKLLSLLGVMPSLSNCVTCGKEIDKKAMRFSLSSGGVLCPNCFGKDKRARAVLAGTINFISSIEKLPFERITKIKVTKRVGLEVESLLGRFIRYHLDPRLRTLDFIKKIGINA